MSNRLDEIKKYQSIKEVILKKEPDEDVHWLISRVEELEKDLDVLRVKYGITKEERETFLYVDIRELKEENQRYKQALEFYANETNYELKLDVNKSEPFMPHYYKWVERDVGEKARKALEQGNE